MNTSTPENEWRSELKEGLKEQILTAQKMIGLMQPKSDDELITVVLPNLHIFTHNFIENLLDQHSARLVERIKAEKYKVPTDYVNTDWTPDEIRHGDSFNMGIDEAVAVIIGK